MISSHKMNKDDVSKRFSKAQKSYVDHAVVQKKICTQLFMYMQNQNFLETQNRIFEIGCGTGNFSQIILNNFKYEQYFLNDIYSDVRENFVHYSNLNWCIGDVEKLEFPQQLDLIVSSSALQWMDDLNHIFRKAHSALNKGGYLCFSSFGQMNLKEIKMLTGRGLDYLSLDEMKKILEQIGFEIEILTEAIEPLLFDEPQQILKHLKATGVTATSNQFRWNKQSLANFYENYEQFKSENQQYSLTYHPIYCIARRK